MHAVVLVGGFGTRLRPLTNTVPKSMLPIAHVPLIVRLIARLEAGGVDGVTLALGFLPEPFVEAFPDGRCGGVTLDYAIESEPLDTAGAIRFAADHSGIDDTFVVANGDVLTDLDVGALVATHRAAARRGHDPSDPGRGSLGVRRRRAGRRRTHPALRREAAAGNGAEQPDQRRHLRVRAERAAAHPAGPAGLDRARHVPARRRRWPFPRPRDGGLLDRRRAARCCTCGPTSTSSTGDGRRRPWPSPPAPSSRPPRPSRAASSTAARRSARVPPSPARCCCAGADIGPGAVVDASIVAGTVGRDAHVSRAVIGADAKIGDREQLHDVRVPAD